MSQIQTTQDTKAELSETSSEDQTKGRSKYAKDDSDTLMMRINGQKMKMMRDPNADDYVETSRKMVKFFAADPEYKQDYILVSGVKVYVEGTVEMNEARDSESIHKRNNSF